MPDLPQGVVTFLFTDVVGSSHLWEHYPQAMWDALVRHDALIEASVADHEGVVVRPRGEGDSRFAVFPQAAGAMAAAVAMQRALHAEPWLLPQPLRVRIALHTGAAGLREGDYYGPVVNRCARLRAIAHGGQILVSSATAEAGRERLGSDLGLRPLGSYRLKDLQRPEQVFQLVHRDLPADFPPLPSLDAYPHNLPLQLTSFIGREREMAEVKRLITAARLVTITGSGGAGKTRLAFQAAAEVLEAFPDGVWLADLAGLTDAALVPPTVTATLGAREQPGRPLIDTLGDFLRPRSLLLILDNCEHLLSACADLSHALLRSCPRLHILATSRAPLGVSGEIAWRIPSLSMPDLDDLGPADRLDASEAVRLFVERAVAALPSFALTGANAGTIGQICRRLDGIPLALELAAARVRVLSVAQIADRLDDRFRLLTGGIRTALPRQQTLRAAMDWSHDLLTEDERRLLRRVAVFAGGWTLEAAEEVCSADLETLTGLLEKSLVDKSLVVEEGGEQSRYRLLETVRQYGREKLLGSGEADAVRTRHQAFFLALAAEAEPHLTGAGQTTWLNRLEIEHDNLRAALEWGKERGDAGIVLQLAGALWRFWMVRGHFTEGRSWLEWGLAHSDLGDHRTAHFRARALAGAGSMAWSQGDYAQAVTFHESSLALSRVLDDRSGMAMAFNNLGAQALEQGQWQRGRELCEQGLALYRDLNDRRGVALTLSNLAYGAHAEGHYARARAFAEESLTILRDIRDGHGMAMLLDTLGEVAREEGDDVGAVAALEEGLVLAREAGDNRLLAHILSNLGLAHERTGDTVRARALYDESLTLYRALADKGWVAECLERLAGILDVQGGPAEAARLLGAVETIRETVGAALKPIDHAAHIRRVAALRDSLGQERFAAVWAQGRAMTIDQATDFALASRPTGVRSETG